MIQIPCNRSDNSAVLRDIVERAILEHGVSVHGRGVAGTVRAFASLAAWPGKAAPARERGEVHHRERELKGRIVAAAWTLGIELVADGESVLEAVEAWCPGAADQ